MTIEIEDLQAVDAWEQTGALLPIGTFLAEVTEVEEKPAGTGSPQVIITWRAVEGPHSGSTRKEWLVILPQTYGKVKAFLAALNWPLKEGKFNMPTDDLVKRRAVITVADEPYDGKSSLRVVAHMPVGTSIPVAQPVAAGVSAESDDSDLPFLWRPVEWAERYPTHNPFA